MENKQTPGGSGTQQAQGDRTQQAHPDGQHQKNKPIGFDPDTVKEALTGTHWLNKGGFETPKARLEYVCQNYGLQFRQLPADNATFFAAVFDQLRRPTKTTDRKTLEKNSRYLRNEVYNFLNENRVYQGSNGKVNFEDHLTGQKTFQKWLKELQKEGSKVDHVAVIATAIVKQRNIVLITGVPDSMLADPHNAMTIIPALTGKDFDIENSILLGYYGESRFQSLEPIFDLVMTTGSRAGLSRRIELTKSHHQEAHHHTKHKINVEKLLPRTNHDVIAHDVIAHDVIAPKPDKKYGTMTIQKDGKVEEILPGKLLYKNNEKAFSCPVISYEATERELIVKWQWHNDKRHVVTTVQVVGLEFIDRSGVKWCDSKIRDNDKDWRVRQCYWEHKREDNQKEQRIDCLLPCVKYRIFLVDHFRSTLYTNTIERTISEMMYYTPAPSNLLLRVIDSSRDEQLALEWRLAEERSMNYLESVELCIENEDTKKTFVLQKDSKGRLNRRFALRKINQNIKVNITVKTKHCDELDELSDVIELVIIHPPEPSPKIDQHPEKNMAFRYGKRGQNSEFPEDPTLSRSNAIEETKGVQTIIEMHKLQCGAVACQRASTPREQSSPSPSQHSTTPSSRQSSAPPSQHSTTTSPRQSSAPPSQHSTTPSPQQQSPPPSQHSRTPSPQQQSPPPSQHSRTPTPRLASPPPPKHSTTPPPLQPSPPPSHPEHEIHNAEGRERKLLPSRSQLRIPLSCCINDNNILLGLGDGRMTSDENKEEVRHPEKDKRWRDRHREVGKYRRHWDDARRSGNGRRIADSSGENRRHRGNRHRNNEKRRREEMRRDDERYREEEEARCRENEIRRGEKRSRDNERYMEEKEARSRENERRRDDERRRENRKLSEARREEIVRRSEEERRQDNEKSRVEEEERRRENEIRREEERRRENDRRREEEMLSNTKAYHPPEHTTIEPAPRQKMKGWFKILWRRPYMDDKMYLSPYSSGVYS